MGLEIIFMGFSGLFIYDKIKKGASFQEWVWPVMAVLWCLRSMKGTG